MTKHGINLGERFRNAKLAGCVPARWVVDATAGVERQHREWRSEPRQPGPPDLPLFPRGSYFSELALLGPRNFYNLYPSLTVNPRDDLSLTADFDFFWRLETEDGIYNPGGQLLSAGAGSDAHHVGNELSLTAAWQINSHISFTAIYDHFFPGRFSRRLGRPKKSTSSS